MIVKIPFWFIDFYPWYYWENSLILVWQIIFVFLFKKVGNIMNRSFKSTFPICYWKWCFALRLKYFPISNSSSYFFQPKIKFQTRLISIQFINTPSHFSRWFWKTCKEEIYFQYDIWVNWNINWNFFYTSKYDISIVNWESQKMRNNKLKSKPSTK